MDACVGNKTDKFAKIPSSNASTCPRAMMVVHFDSAVSFSTVKAPWGFNDISGWSKF
jgi:hypothetical protein